jgi:ribosomal protein S18 acetylase RimI-like enzyme
VSHPLEDRRRAYQDMSPEPWRHSLREAVLADVLELARLDLVCFDRHAYPADLFLRFLELDLPCVVADGPEGDVIGFAMVMPEPDEGTCVLVTLDVAPGNRRRGLGRRMVAWCARAMMDAEPPMELMWLTVASRNDGAREFYRRLGFKQADTIKDYYRDDDAVVMVHLDLEGLSKGGTEPSGAGGRVRVHRSGDA